MPSRRKSRPSAAPATDAAPSRLPSWLRSNLEQSLPVLTVGVFCVGLAVWLGSTHLHALGSRMPLWTLVAAVGLTLVGGGSALTLVEEPSEGLSGVPDGYLLVLQSDWDRLTEVPVQPASSAATPPVWEEGPAEAEPSVDAVPVTVVPEVDPEAVARASADLVSPALQVTPTSLVGTLAARSVAVEPEPAPASARAGQSALEPSTPIAPKTVPLSVSKDGSDPSAAAEFRDVLSLLERAERSVRSRLAPVPSPTQPRDRCTGCGTAVSTYSEQICVMCDRPLCDRCVDRTAEGGHPQMCDACHAKFGA